ncbi:Coiled-coil domain-containing protein 87 [Allomyces arbusculus]|nr:Coiled-coil domain-containing protein 87 [Allomyces arbusculus]
MPVLAIGAPSSPGPKRDVGGPTSKSTSPVPTGANNDPSRPTSPDIDDAPSPTTAMFCSLLATFDDLSWLLPDERVTLKTAFLSELTLQFSDKLKSVLKQVDGEETVVRLLANLRVIRDNVLHRMRDHFMGLSLRATLPRAATFEQCLVHFRRDLRRHLKPSTLITQARLGGAVRRRYSLPAPPLPRVLQDVDDMVSTITAHLMTHEPVAQILQRAPEPEIARVQEKLRIAAEVQRELHAQSQFHARLRERGMPAALAHTLAMHARPVLGTRIPRTPRTAPTSKPHTAALATEARERIEEEEEAAAAAVKAMAEATGVAAGAGGGKGSVGDDPLLMASFARSPTREWVPTKAVPQERYLPRHAAGSPTRLYEMVDATVAAAAATASEGREKGVDDDDEAQRSLNASHIVVAGDGGEAGGPESLGNMTGIAPPRMTRRDPRGGMAFRLLDMVQWIEDEAQPMDQVTGKDLDSQLSRTQEVEELFDEIMQSVTGGQLLLTEPPAAKKYPAIAHDSLAAQLVHQSTMSLVSRSTIETRTIAHRIQMMPRHVSQHEIHVAADQFARNRAAAMAAVPSSRNDAFRYNFGGYIPQTTVRVRRNRLSIEGYRAFLRHTRVDFLEKEDVDSRMGRPMSGPYNAGAGADDEAELNRRRRAALDLSFIPGSWNTNVLEAMSPPLSPELRDGMLDDDDEDSDDGGARSPPVTRDPGARVGGPSRPPSPTARLAPSPRGQSPTASAPSTRPGSPESQSPARTRPSSPTTDSPRPTRTTAPIEARFERIFVRLAMPIADRLHLAIVYGREPPATQSRAIRRWERATAAILRREAILGDLIAFEYTASQPLRFWDQRTQLLPEAAARAAWVRRLHAADAAVHAAIDAIDAIELVGSAVTRGVAPVPVSYRGRLYREKMAHDYTELLHALVNPIQGERTGDLM